MEFKHLRSFLRVLELGSFSRAAEDLNIVQPALSQHIKKLEEKLNERLFDRTSVGATPTPVGRKLAEYARLILDTAARADAEIRGQREHPFGDVTVGLPSSLCPFLSFPLIERASILYPDIKLMIVENMSGSLEYALEHQMLDIAVLFDREATQKFSSEPMIREKLHVIGPADSFENFPEEFPAQRLSGLPLVSTIPPHGLRALIDRWQGDNKIALNIALEVDSASTILQLVERKNYFSIVPSTAILEKKQNSAIESRPIGFPSFIREACLCTTTVLPFSYAREAIAALIKILVYEQATQGNWEGKLLLGSQPPVVTTEKTTAGGTTVL